MFIPGLHSSLQSVFCTIFLLLELLELLLLKVASCIRLKRIRTLCFQWVLWGEGREETWVSKVKWFFTVELSKCMLCIVTLWESSVVTSISKTFLTTEPSVSTKHLLACLRAQFGKPCSRSVLLTPSFSSFLNTYWTNEKILTTLVRTQRREEK